MTNYFFDTIYGTVSSSTLAPSRKNEPLQDLASQIKDQLKILDREREDLEYVQKQIASLGEVVAEIGSTIRMSISTLQTVAIRLETNRLESPQSGQPAPAPGWFEVQPVAQPAAQIAQVAAGQVVLEPWPPGQV